MVEHKRVLKWQRNRRLSRMRSLLQLTMWGVSATAASTLVVFAALSEAGSERLTTALARPDPAPRLQTTNVEHLAARAAESENEMRRLAETVRTLHADRERLLARIVSLEHGLEDATGSINRQAAAGTPTPAPAPPAVSAQTATAGVPPADSGAAAIANISGSAALPPPAVVATSQELAATSRLAGLSMNEDNAEAEQSRLEFGMDIGGGASFDALRLLWNTTKAANPALFEGLNPAVVARENQRTRAIELRLVAGPVGNADAAARLCAALAKARRYCQPAPFQGHHQLSLVAPEIERPPAAAPARRPAPKAIRPAFGE